MGAQTLPEMAPKHIGRVVFDEIQSYDVCVIDVRDIPDIFCHGVVSPVVRFPSQLTIDSRFMLCIVKPCIEFKYLTMPQSFFRRNHPMSSSHETITEAQGQALVRLARKTLLERFGRKLDTKQAIQLNETLKAPVLQVHCGTFVTLKLDGCLRGCIGSLTGCEPLVKGVRSHAVNAAFNDPRFSPLDAEELDRTTIEVSVLSEPQPLIYVDADDLVAKLHPGSDGVILRKGHSQATFLPQVWEQLPKAQDFLTHLCTKAGLGGSDWRHTHLEVEVYQVRYFEEHR
jgi:AmmeMemoRadiSam system protein A